MTGSTTREKQTQIILTFFNTLAEKKTSSKAEKWYALNCSSGGRTAAESVAKAVRKEPFWPDFPVRKHSTIFQKNGLLYGNPNRPVLEISYDVLAQYLLRLETEAYNYGGPQNERGPPHWRIF